MDDDDAIRETLPIILERSGFACTAVASVPEAIAAINHQKFDILLSDLNIGEPGDGFIVVGAMRRVQPQARTFILTGYPDFTSALEAIRRQVDDYIIKPANIHELLKTLRTIPDRERIISLPGKRASTVIRERTGGIIDKWLEETQRDPELQRLRLSREARINHLPFVLKQLANRLDRNADFDDAVGMESAWEHGHVRRQQAYTIPLIVAETGVLYRTISNLIQEHLAEMDISSIIPDLILISENLNAMLVESLRSFLSGETIAA